MKPPFEYSLFAAIVIFALYLVFVSIFTLPMPRMVWQYRLQNASIIPGIVLAASGWHLWIRNVPVMQYGLHFIVRSCLLGILLFAGKMLVHTLFFLNGYMDDRTRLYFSVPVTNSGICGSGRRNLSISCAIVTDWENPRETRKLRIADGQLDGLRKQGKCFTGFYGAGFFGISWVENGRFVPCRDKVK
jgi:hypothetical protein